MTPEVEAEYQRALKAAVLKHGALTDPKSHAYGWIANDWDHKHSCKLSSPDQYQPIEAHWTEFNDSFDSEGDARHGVDLKGVSCACGQVQDRTLRWDANPYEMVRLVFAEGKIP